MEIQSVSALRGPNVWASFPVLEAWVHLGQRKDTASCEFPGFNERLTSWLPSLVEHRCSEGVRGGLFRRLRQEAIAKTKIGDLNTTNMDAACRIIAGTARNMGIEVDG